MVLPYLRRRESYRHVLATSHVGWGLEFSGYRLPDPRRRGLPIRRYRWFCALRSGDLLRIVDTRGDVRQYCRWAGGGDWARDDWPCCRPGDRTGPSGQLRDGTVRLPAIWPGRITRHLWCDAAPQGGRVGAEIRRPDRRQGLTRMEPGPGRASRPR